MPPDVGEPPVSTVAFDRDSMATWYAKQHLKVDEGIEEVVYLPTNAGEREIRFLEINKEMLDPDDHLEPINYGVDMGTGVSRRPKPASDRRAISGHLPGAFRPTGHPTALPPKESCDGECDEDGDYRGDSIVTIGRTILPCDRTTTWDPS